MFIAYVNQTDWGCKYTIACGKKLIELKAKTHEEAIEELKRKFVDSPNNEADYTEELNEIILYEVFNKFILPISEWYQEAKDQWNKIEQDKQLEAEQKEYERLRQKFG